MKLLTLKQTNEFFIFKRFRQRLLPFLITCLFFFLCQLIVFSQSDECGTPSPTKEEVQSYLEFIRTASPKSSSRTSQQIPIHFVVIYDGSGNDPYGSSPIENNLIAWVDFANSAFTNDMSFYICDITEYDNSTFAPYYIKIQDDDDDDDLYNLFHDPEAITVYVVKNIIPSGNSVSAYAKFPWDNPRMIITTGSTSEKTLAHELGHFFGLFHTFMGFTTGQDPNLPCAGDIICDTPVDPGFGNCGNSSCSSSCTVGGLTYTPDKSNVMSYYGTCIVSFTPDQFSKMELNYDFHPNRTYLHIPPASCVSSLIAGKGIVSKVKSSDGIITIPMNSVNMDMAESGTTCQTETGGTDPDFFFAPELVIIIYMKILL